MGAKRDGKKWNESQVAERGERERERRGTEREGLREGIVYMYIPFTAGSARKKVPLLMNFTPAGRLMNDVPTQCKEGTLLCLTEAFGNTFILLKHL